MIYVTQKGDQWDIIAKNVYGDELKADVIMDANPLLADVYEFDYGTNVECPELTTEQADGLPPWRV